MDTESETLSLAEATKYLLEECRMVLPGVQALFGFQLVAVFNAPFFEKLTHAEQCIHLLALALVAIAGALIMSPASYHRQTTPRATSADFLRLGGRLLLTAMVPLLLGIGLDFYLIARIVLGSSGFAALEAFGLALFFVLCWFALPRWGRKKRSF
jgi:hypothetical protein